MHLKVILLANYTTKPSQICVYVNSTASYQHYSYKSLTLPRVYQAPSCRFYTLTVYKNTTLLVDLHQKGIGNIVIYLSEADNGTILQIMIQAVNVLEMFFEALRSNVSDWPFENLKWRPCLKMAAKMTDSS